VAIALILTAIFAFLPPSDPGGAAPVTQLKRLANGFNGWAYLLGRILLGEDFKANGQR
jgi:hypothetical protein